MFTSGSGVVVSSIVKGFAASSLELSEGNAGIVFSCFMAGTMFTQLLNGYFIKFIKIRTEITLSIIIYFVCVYFICKSTHFMEVVPILFLMGMVFGIIVTIPFYLIVNGFKGENRSSKLNMLDFFFRHRSFCISYVFS
jgi:fucose permease